MKGLRRSAIRTCPALAFFIAFPAFCYSDMAQMPLGMAELASPLFAAITLFIGPVLAIVTLLTALTTVIRPGDESIAARRAFGHSFRECRWAILEGYRAASYVGFAAGSLCQYALIKIMLRFLWGRRRPPRPMSLTEWSPCGRCSPSC